MGEPVFFHISELQREPAQPSDTPAAAAADAPPGNEPPVATQDPAAASQRPADAASAAAEGAPAEQAAGPAEEAQEAQEQHKQDTPSGKQRERRPPLDRSVELSSMVQPGDAVEFVVAASSHDGVRHRGSRPPRMTAKQVTDDDMHAERSCRMSTYAASTATCMLQRPRRALAMPASMDTACNIFGDCFTGTRL